MKHSEHKKRLNKRLKKLRLVSLNIPADGSCQFSSISDQLFGTWKENREVRKNVVNQLIKNKHFYSVFIPEHFDVYCTRMSSTKSWGDNVTVQAASDYYGVRIYLITSAEDCILVQITPRELKSERILWLSYVGGVHFNSLYSLEGKFPLV